MAHTILIVEDDPDINNLLAKILEEAGYQYKQAFSGTEALMLLEKEKFDLLLLDLMLPGLTGQELLAKIRQKEGFELPIMIISAKTLLESKITALKAGADDYLVKPFEPMEVLARVEALLRRTKQNQKQKLVYRELTLFPSSRKVLMADQELSLTAHEYDILYLLMKEPEKVYSRERLYQTVWQDSYYGGDNTVNVHISNLRKKLKEVLPQADYIQTVYGIGFKLL
ncbi:response regulator transcription factor [Streptococcus oricebi]|uniref:DNA-binding response regulator n=1 Tax=Streptococcus oricebi TaxID=1547447 RepID=A0ABS5B458_9STRE|nr:response regulator transcription factor [Streptococcus oricebi]MBP2623594.1 DNA-binding response regulator [Streptococcus oricebi]